jgi:ABC-type uncharacterized transport system permease subunit
MSGPLTLNLIALATLIPAALVPLRNGTDRGALFWTFAVTAAVGSATWAVQLSSDAWSTELGAALWISVAATALQFLGLSATTRSGWRLAPLLMPYLFLIGILASTVGGQPRPLTGGAPAVWLDLHIFISVLTYGLLTLAAVASLAVFLQERALKRKQPTRLTRALPAVVEGEALSGRLLLGSEVILGLGMATGMATQYFETGLLLRLDHKALLSLIAFVLIGILLLGRRACGVRGRIAARIVLLAYLLLTLSYPGVKFVTQVLL